MNASFQQKLKSLLTRENLIYLLFASAYLHYIATAAAAFFAALLLLIRADTRRQIFVHSGSLIFVIFSVFGALLAVIFSNWLGLACSVGFFVIMVVGFWVRTVMRRGVFERALSFCCAESIAVGAAVIVEWVIKAPHSGGDAYRCSLWFANPNYLGVMSVIAFACCVYKLLRGRGHMWIYIAGIIANIVSIYLCASLFIWVELFLTTSVLLIMFGKWPTLGLFFGIMSAFLMTLYFAPQILPRYGAVGWTTEQRLSIWTASLDAIKRSPFFGHGFLTYLQICKNYPGAFVSPHTHNLLLDPLLNFGIVGTALLLTYFVFYFAKLKECYDSPITKKSAEHLILALTISTIVHGLVDVTFLWIQTGLLLALIMGGIGISERRLGAAAARLARSRQTTPEDGPRSDS